MQRSFELFKSIARNNPKFNSDLCNMFGKNIPSYIKEQVVQYASNKNKLCCNEFINYVPSYMLVNACENRHNVIDETMINSFYKNN